tara:strand:+ start:1593 stop:2270 length:678 start_codon:yes stop_codon:yes gene_type:complete
MTKAIAIYRCSTEAQKISNNGIAAQKIAVHKYAAENGIEIVQEEYDLGISGTAPIDKRTGLLTAMASLQKGMILLCAKLDRLSRDMLFQLVLEKEIKKRGCRIVSAAHEGTESDSPADILMRQMLQAFSQFEVNLIKSRTRASLAARKAQGLRTGTIPYGYKCEPDGRLIPCQEAQNTLSIVKDFRANGMSWRASALELNRQNIYNRKGRPWSQRNLWLCCRDRV